MSQPKIYAMVPARYGSTRLKLKNLALINGKPMISYAIQAAQGSGVFDKVIVNSENPIFQKTAERYGCDFYLRSNDLGSSAAKSDSVVNDFIRSFPDADIVAWVNPISPFQTKDEIQEIVQYFLNNNLDSLITVENKQVHCIYKGNPVNYDKDGLLAQTQDLTPVQAFVYSIMIWRSSVFVTEYAKHGHALFCGRFGVHPVRKRTEIIIKTQEDLVLADLLMRAIEINDDVLKVEYDYLAKITE